MLDVSGLSKEFTVGKDRVLHAVDNVSFTLGANESLGIVGESGSGKSTLARMITGLLPKTSGEIVLNGETLPAHYRSADFRRLGTTVQMVFQDPFGSLNPRLTVAELVGEPLHILRNPIPLILRDRVDYWLAQTGLSTRFRDRYPHELSGGQRQRVCIARALCVEPKLLVLDEPISALDVSVQAQIINLLVDLRAKLGLSMIFIGHDLAMVRHLCDKTLVMYLGAVMEAGNTCDVLNTPQHPYTQALLAARPLPDPQHERQRTITLLPDEPPSPVNLSTGCRFQPRCSISEKKCVMEAPAIATYGNTQLSCWRAGNTISSNHIAATDTSKPANNTAPQ